MSGYASLRDVACSTASRFRRVRDGVTAASCLPDAAEACTEVRLVLLEGTRLCMEDLAALALVRPEPGSRAGVLAGDLVDAVGEQLAWMLAALGAVAGLRRDDVTDQTRRDALLLLTSRLASVA